MLLTIIIPIYKKNKLSDSISIQKITDNISYMGSDIETRIIVWNNGPYSVENDIRSSRCFSISVKQSLNNDYLSKIYNQCIKDVDSDYYLILDDDTNVNNEYVKAISNYLLNNGQLLAVPRIYCNDNIVSPINEKNKNSVLYPLLSTADYRVIGSGLLIPKKIIATMGEKLFDENLSLYGVDTKFFYDYRIKYTYFSVLNVTVQHDVAGLNKLSLNSYKFREENLVSALIYILFKCKGVRFLYIRRVFQVIFLYVIRTRSVGIFRAAFKRIVTLKNDL